MMRRTTSWAALATAVALALSGCEFKGAASIPLPGGEATGPDAYRVTVEFSDVLDLVPQSAVKVDDVTVGSVESIDLAGYTARVVVRVRDDVVLPANTRASLRQTSLLGEKFVSLDRPKDEPAQGRLRDDSVITLESTQRGAEIEEVLSALSLVLNGGSLEQLQVINRELATALKGREDKVRDLFRQLNTFVGGLDQQKAQIVRALDGLDKLTARLARDRQTLATALEDIPPGVAVLTEQREQLTAVLTSLDELGDVAVRVIRASQQATVEDLRALEPVLRQLANAGKNLPDALEILLTYPFPRTVDQGIKGDFSNLFVTLDINLQDTNDNLGSPLPIPPLPLASPSPTRSAPDRPAVPAVPPAPDVRTPPLPGLPGIDGITALSGQPLDTGLLRLLLGGLS